MKALLVGSQGQLGSTLIETCPPEIQLIAGDVAEFDITAAETLRASVEEIQPNLIINAAAYTQVDQAEEVPELAKAINAEGPANLTEAAKAVRARLIHISTDYVFSGKRYRPYRPDHNPDPQSVYGATKLQGEKAILTRYPKKSLIFRTAWVYSDVGNNFLLTMLKLMQSDRSELGIIADQIGTPTSTYSLADLIWRAAQSSDAAGLFHWTDQGVASWYDFAIAIQEQALAAGLLTQTIPIRPLRTEEYRTKAERPSYSVLDKRDTERTFRMPGVHWRTALAAVIERLAAKQSA